MNRSRQSGHEDFGHELWNQFQFFEVEGMTFQTSSREDFLIHLLLHASGHFKSSGFGIHQCCDLVLWLEQRFDWDYEYVFKRLNELNILTFSKYLLEVCHQLLDLEAPEILRLTHVRFKCFRVVNRYYFLKRRTRSP